MLQICLCHDFFDNEINDDNDDEEEDDDDHANADTNADYDVDNNIDADADENIFMGRRPELGPEKGFPAQFPP